MFRMRTIATNTTILTTMILALEWGGSWTTFKDLPHYQMKTALTLAQVQQRFEAGGAIIV